MNTRTLAPLIAAMLVSFSAHAHDCSGGANGGMDATGNQCNDPVAATAIDSTDRTSATTPKAKPEQVASSKKIVTHTHLARHASGRSRMDAKLIR